MIKNFIDARRVNFIDALKVVAMIMVISTHFLSYTQLKEIKVEGGYSVLIKMLDSLFRVCVPFFFICTGYLLGNRGFNLNKHYFKIVKVIEEYLLVAIICIIVKFFYYPISGISYGYAQALKEIIFIKGSPYSWYVTHYIVLFFLIPVINLLWKYLKSKTLQISVIVFLSLFIAVSSYYRYRIDFIGFYFGKNLFGLLYFLIGKYIRDYNLIHKDVQHKKVWTYFILAMITIALNTMISYHIYYGTVYETVANGYGEVDVILTALCLFIGLGNLFSKRDSFPDWVSKLSSLSLLFYLVSWVFDIYVYPVANRLVPIEYRLILYPGCVGIVFTCSTIAAEILRSVKVKCERASSKFRTCHSQRG